MNIAVIGSRSFGTIDSNTNKCQSCEYIRSYSNRLSISYCPICYQYLTNILDQHFDNDDTLISGGAIGADKLAEKYADNFNINKLIIIPQWNKYGKSAGMIRNKHIIDKSDKVIAFWDGSSRGTAHSIRLSKQQGKEVFIYKFNGSIVK